MPVEAKERRKKKKKVGKRTFAQSVEYWAEKVARLHPQDDAEFIAGNLRKLAEALRAVEHGALTFTTKDVDRIVEHRLMRYRKSIRPAVQELKDERDAALEEVDRLRARVDEL